MTSSASLPRPGGWLTTVVVAQLAFGLVAMTICLPSMQDWPAIFGASQASVQLTFSGFVAAFGALQLVYGALSDRHGRKPLILAGLVLAVAGSVLAAVATSLPVLTAARILQGAGCAAGMVIGRALVQDLFDGPDRTRMMAYVGMSLGVCPPLATLVGGQLHVRLGWQSNFVLLAVVGLALLVAAWRVLPAARPPTRPAGGAGAHIAAGYAQLLRQPAFVLYVSLLGTTTAAFYTFLAGAPIVLAGYGVTPERLGWYVMVPPLAYILGNMLTSRLVRRRGDASIMLTGQLCSIAGLLIVLALAAAGVNTPWSLSLPLVLVGIGHGLLVPPTLAGTVGLLPALAGSAAAVAGLSQQLTGALGGYLVGLVPHQGAAMMASLMLGWTLLGLLAQGALRMVLRRQK